MYFNYARIKRLESLEETVILKITPSTCSAVLCSFSKNGRYNIVYESKYEVCCRVVQIVRIFLNYYYSNFYLR